MTIEEAKSLAESGDVAAAISLGNYYVVQKTGEDIEEAVKWFEKAAKYNHLFAIHMTVLGKKILAYSGLQVVSSLSMGSMEAEFLIKDWQDVYHWAEKELDCIKRKVMGIERIKVDDAVKNYEESAYYLALCYFWNDQFKSAVDLVHDIKDVRSTILYCVSVFMMEKNLSYLEKAEKMLDSVIYNAAYAAAAKANFEEDVYALAALQLSSVYKNKGSQINMERAVSLLNHVLNAVKNNNNKDLLTKELNRYQKKAIGGYMYV